MVGDLADVKVKLRTVRGPVASERSRDGRKLSLHVGIPPNTTATLPAADVGSLTEDGRAIADATWVKFVGWQGGAATCEICAGGYTFRSVQPGAAGH